MNNGRSLDGNESGSISDMHSEENVHLGKEVILEASLLSLYLNRWQEESKKHPGRNYNKAWKNHPFEVLDELQDRKCIRTFFNLKTVLLTEEGMAKGELLMKRYFANRPGGIILKYRI